MQTRQQTRRAQQRGQWTLVGILVSMAIIAILSAWYYAKILKPQVGSHNGRPAAEQKAYGAVCSEYQSQLTQAVAMYKDEHNDRNPRSFEALKKYGATDDIVKAEGCQFQLDASTGTVTEIGHGQAAPNAQPVVINSSSDAAPAAPSAPGPYWQQPASPSPPGSSSGSQSAPTRGPGGVTLPPTSGTIPTDGGGE